MGVRKQTPVAPRRLLEAVTASLEDDKALEVIVIDLAGKTDFADFMVIATGTSKRHVTTLAEHLRERMKAAGLKGGAAFEGLARGDWVLIDGGDVVVHLFRPEVRAYYDLEKIWGLPAAAQAQ